MSRRDQVLQEQKLVNLMGAQVLVVALFPPHQRQVEDSSQQQAKAIVSRSGIMMRWIKYASMCL